MHSRFKQAAQQCIDIDIDTEWLWCWLHC